MPHNPSVKAGRTAAQSRCTLNAIPPAALGGKEQLVPAPGSRRCVEAAAPMPELNLDETIRIRGVFSELGHEESITNKFDLRVLLAELGIYPSDDELTLLLEAFECKITFTNLCHYLRFYKREFQISAQQRRGNNPAGPAQDDSEDTLRAFISLGGGEDGTGTVNVEDLREVCRNFGLTIDIDAMLNNVVDTESQSTLNYTEFCDMWQSRRRRSEFGSLASVQESAFDTRGSLRALALGYSGQLKGIAGRSDASSTLQARPTVKEEDIDMYHFPQSQRDQSQTGCLPHSEEEHLQALQRFLFPEVSASVVSPTCGAAARRKGGRRPSG
ncbi:hypothetical protein DQ04_04031000, partial [Trypanosoma grayi]|uniref:hypothetical protein n=1 Tax=Trypanosoma grayi TaxID=71804 RepID=UPI0004F47DDD